MPKTVHETLVESRALIATPATWTTFTCARDALGRAVDPDDPRATCFCAIGAAYRVENGDPDQAIEILGYVAIQLYPEREGGISIVNDNEGHEAVLACFDAAIKATA